VGASPPPYSLVVVKENKIHQYNNMGAVGCVFVIAHDPLMTVRFLHCFCGDKRKFIK
jgi:hypothetical protein